MAKSKKKENGLAEAFAAADEAKANAEAEKAVAPVEAPETEKAEAGEAKANAEADKKEANSADALKLRKFGKFQGKGK